MYGRNEPYMKLTEVKILDKKEYRAKLDEINDLVEKQDYREALKVVETIEWRRVRSARTLCMVSEIYEVNKRYDDSLRLLLLAYQRAPSGKLILYRLVELSVKMTDYENAIKYYNQFVKLSPNDNNRYILKYKIYKGRKSPLEDQIKILEQYKKSEYTERWAYELARLYAKAGMQDKCIEECNELVLWFSDGRYVKKALELKMKYTELTTEEKDKYKKLYGEPKAVRIARTAASVSAATQAAAKMLNQTAQTMGKSEEAVKPVKVEALQFPKPESSKEIKSELSEQPKAMSMPEFIKTPEIKADFEPLPEIQMPEEIKKEIEEEIAKKKLKEDEAQETASKEESAEETDKAEEAETMEEAVEQIAEEAAKEPAGAENETVTTVEEKLKSLEAEPETETESEVPEGATIQLPLEEIKAARQSVTETDATIDLSKVTEEVMAEAVVTDETEPVESETPVEIENEEVQEQKSDETVEKIEKTESEPAQSESAGAESEEAEQKPEKTESEPEKEKVFRHHLTDEEHRRLFTYFAPIPGMKEQVKEALDVAQESACEKTSKSGNMIVTGRSGSGKTRFSESLIKALCKERCMEGAKVAYLTAEVLNKKDPAFIVDKLSGGFLAIGQASAMTAETVENLSKAMEFKTNRLTVILEDTKAGIYTLKQDYPEFMEKFDSRIVIPVFTNDELVSFAKTYAKEKGYKVDDIAVLAVYSLIGDNQYEDDPVCVGQVREMMDSAIAKASRLGRRPGKKVAKRHLDVTGRIMLYEKDFNL